MTREILFRVKRADNPELVGGWRATINTAESAAEAWNRRTEC